MEDQCISHERLSASGQNAPFNARATGRKASSEIETARKLGVDETEAGHGRAFGEVGLKKPKKGRRKK